MAFDFHHRLSTSRRRLNERSDTLEAGNQSAVRQASQAVADAFNAQLALPPVRISVLKTRPQRGGSEYHGYYDGADSGKTARITLWMFTARRRQVVAYRTFLRTLVHELCHHLDFEGFRLDESFHADGFYKRESALFRGVVGEPPAAPNPRRASAV